MGSIAYYAAGVAWASIFGFSFLVTKSALDSFGPFTLLFLRFALAFGALALLAALRVVKLDYKGKPKAPLALVCALQPVAYFAFETFGVRATATSTAGLILGAMPAAVAAASVPLLKERLSKVQIGGLALSVAGVAAVVLAGTGGSSDGRQADSLTGIALVIGALACAALYNVYSRKASARFTPVETTFAMMASGAAAFAVPAIVELSIGSRAALGRGGAAAACLPGVSEAAGLAGGWAGLLSAPAAAWGAIAYLGILSSVVAFFLVNLSLSRLKAAQAAVFGALVTLVSLAAGVVARGEAFGPLRAFAAAAIIAGVLLTNLGKDTARGRGTFAAGGVPKGGSPKADAPDAASR